MELNAAFQIHISQWIVIDLERDDPLLIKTKKIKSSARNH